MAQDLGIVNRTFGNLVLECSIEIQFDCIRFTRYTGLKDAIINKTSRRFIVQDTWFYS